MRTETYVYIIGKLTDDGLIGPIKVGITRNVTARLAQLQTGNADRLGVVAALMIPGRDAAYEIERDFHDRAAHRRLSGEWFSMNPIEAIEAICRNVRQMLAATGRPIDAQQRVFYAIGAWHAELRARADKYHAAWESLAA